MPVTIGKDQNALGRCLTCRYAQRIDEEDYDAVPDWCDYECHRHAPTMVPAGDGRAMSVWPGISGFDWCGEWMPDHEEAEHGGRHRASCD